MTPRMPAPTMSREDPIQGWTVGSPLKAPGELISRKAGKAGRSHDPASGGFSRKWRWRPAKTFGRFFIIWPIGASAVRVSTDNKHWSEKLDAPSAASYGAAGVSNRAKSQALYPYPGSFSPFISPSGHCGRLTPRKPAAPRHA